MKAKLVLTNRMIDNLILEREANPDADRYAVAMDEYAATGWIGWIQVDGRNVRFWPSDGNLIIEIEYGDTGDDKRTWAVPLQGDSLLPLTQTGKRKSRLERVSEIAGAMIAEGEFSLSDLMAATEESIWGKTE